MSPAKKKPVGKQPICSDRQLRQIDPIWVFDKVPKGFWLEPENRRNYLIWLAHRLHGLTMESLYRLDTRDVQCNCGGGVLFRWHGSLIEGVKECFPDYDWKEWLFAVVPHQFWDDPRNHYRYLEWLGQELGFRRREDWYRVTCYDFDRYRGSKLLKKFGASVSTLMRACFPEHPWHEWLFTNTPKRFWSRRVNQRRYMDWLGKTLGYTCREDWYRTTERDLLDHKGKSLLVRHGSVGGVVMACFPEHEWHEWEFPHVPPGFWKRRKNRYRYMEWLGKVLGFRCPEDWSRVCFKDISKRRGKRLLAGQGPLRRLVQEHLEALGKK